MRVGRSIDKLSIDPNLSTQPTDASFQYVAYAQLASDLLRDDWLVPVRERGIARDHEHIRDPRQIGRQILGNAVREILLLRIIAEVTEGQHYDRQAWGSHGRRI